MLSVGSALAPMTVSGRLPYCALLRKLSSFAQRGPDNLSPDDERSCPYCALLRKLRSVAQRGPAWGWLSE